MEYKIEHALQILQRTPYILEAFLKGLDEPWVSANEGPGTWNPFDVMGHLIHGEKTDWITRVNIILSDESERKFKPFNRFAQFNESKGKTLNSLIDEFKILRKDSLQKLNELKISEATLNETGIHPAFGQVTLRQLLATWVVHDFTHIAQITRVMAKQYKEEVGPWIEYLSVLR